MKKVLLSAATAILLSTSVNADFLGLEAGYASWSPELTGTIKGNAVGDIDIDMENNLGYGDTTANSYFWLYFDHPLPMLPNLKIQKTSYSDAASKATNIVYDGKTYNAGTVTSGLTLDQIDMIGYYRVLDNWVNIDLGFNVKRIDGTITLSDGTATDTNKQFSTFIPMLYGKAKIDLPFTGLSIEADGSYIGYSGSKFTDMKAGIVYETSYGLGIVAGYRAQNLTLDDIDNTNTNIDINGMYAGLYYHF